MMPTVLYFQEIQMQRVQNGHVHILDKDKKCRSLQIMKQFASFELNLAIPMHLTSEGFRHSGEIDCRRLA